MPGREGRQRAWSRLQPCVARGQAVGAVGCSCQRAGRAWLARRGVDAAKAAGRRAGVVARRTRSGLRSAALSEAAHLGIVTMPPAPSMPREQGGGRDAEPPAGGQAAPAFPVPDSAGGEADAMREPAAASFRGGVVPDAADEPGNGRGRPRRERACGRRGRRTRACWAERARGFRRTRPDGRWREQAARARASSRHRRRRNAPGGPPSGRPDHHPQGGSSPPRVTLAAGASRPGCSFVSVRCRGVCSQRSRDDLVSRQRRRPRPPRGRPGRRAHRGAQATHEQARHVLPKVFIPLTALCRDVCGYCTFARPPRRGERAYLSEEEVLSIARAGAAAGCREALFTLGDRPERRYAVARRELEELGCATTLEYLARARDACSTRRACCRI